MNSVRNVLILILSSVAVLMLSSCAGGGDDVLKQFPAWAESAVWYQIFPERFANGDPSNDPKIEDTVGSWPFDYDSPWQISPWTSDWYALQPWEEANGRGFYWNAQRRRYGGDLQGVIDKLDYLQELGINAIYLNPIFESPSLHKYDGSSYHHIDNNFGPDPEGDAEIILSEKPDDPATWTWTAADRLFLKLIDEVHRRDMKIIIDGVFNHTGIEFWAFRDIVEKQQESEYLDWYNILSFDDPETAEDEFDYACWYGARTLPEITEDENGLVKPARDYVFASVSRWMDPDGDGDPSDGIDGWRLDVAEMVKIAFWQDFSAHVRSINPEAYMVGEVWWKDWPSNVMFNAEEYIGPQCFDAVMNYRFGDAAYQFFVFRDKKISASAMIDKLLFVQREYDNRYLHVLPNYFDSHDTERLATVAVNPDNYIDHFGNYSGDNPLSPRKPTAEEYELVKTLTAFQMLYRGAPAVYYGTETGMWGLDDPDERKPMIWAEIVYDDEKALPDGTERAADTVAFNEDMFGHMRTLIHFRRSHPALMHGDVTFTDVSDSEDRFAFIRSADEESLYVVFNYGTGSSTFKPAVKPEKRLIGNAVLTGDDLTVAGRSFAVFLLSE